MNNFLISFIIIFIICQGLLADGVQPSGSGTNLDPFDVLTLENLLWISTNSDSWDKYFIQSININATETQNWNNGEGFSPIGINWENSFTGSYNGQSNSIDGLYINRPFINYQGFFGSIKGDSLNMPIIENLTITNANINGSSNVGSLIGSTFWTNIYNCHSQSNLNGITDVGGLIGSNGNNSIVNNCSSSGFIYDSVD